MTKKNVNEISQVWKIPKKYFPRHKGNECKEYVQEIRRSFTSLKYNLRCLQYSSSISLFNITSITSKTLLTPKKRDVFDSVEEFVYHYENFCNRVFSNREKTYQFINSFYNLGIPKKEVGLNKLKIALSSKPGLISLLSKFENKSLIIKTIEERNRLTHNLYFNETNRFLQPTPNESKDFEKFIKNWASQIKARSKQSLDTYKQLLELNSRISIFLIREKN